MSWDVLPISSLVEKVRIVTKDTEEIILTDELKHLLKNKAKPVSYWGIAPTGPPHIGYYRSIAKQIDLVKAGFHHKILIADLHSYLDDRKSELDELKLIAKRKSLEKNGIF